VAFLILCFTLCPFVTKMRSIFLIWTRIVFLNGQMFFFSQNGQMGSLLICNWLHSTGQNHFHVMMLFIRGLVIFRSLFFRDMFLEDSAPISSQRNLIPCICPDDVIFYPDPELSKHHPFGRRELSVWTFLYVQKLSKCSKLHPSGHLSNMSELLSVFDKLNNFFPKHRYGKTAATVRTMCVLVRMLSLIRQVVHTKFNHPHNSIHGPDAQALYMKIACISSTVWTSYFLVRTFKALIWKLCAAKVQPSGQGSIRERISSEF
jgi:hypothetical protein